MQPLRLNLGCGTRKKPGFVNVDKFKGCDPDIVADLLVGLPFNSLSVDEIVSENFLEHLPGEEFILVMNECYRVLKVGGVATHIVPNALHPGGAAFRDPTHKIFITHETWYYFLAGHPFCDVTGFLYGIMPWKSVKVEAFNIYLRAILYK